MNIEFNKTERIIGWVILWIVVLVVLGLGAMFGILHLAFPDGMM